MSLEITDGNFKELVLESDKPVLVDFWATWCGPCRTIAPVVDEISDELDGKAIVGKVNVDDNSETPVEYGIRSIATLLIFKNGEAVDRIVGVIPKEQIIDKLNQHM